MQNKLWFWLLVLLQISSCSTLFPDREQPECLTFYPMFEAVNISPDVVIQVAFSKDMNKQSVERAFSLTEGSESAVSGSFSWTNNILYFKPFFPLKAEPEYRLTISTAAEDTVGNDLKSELFIRFWITGNGPGPQILSVFPTNSAQITNKNTKVYVTFDQPLDFNSVYESFSFSPSTPGITSLLSNNTVICFTPTVPLSHATKYRITVNATVKNTNEIPMDDDFNSSFTVGTDFSAPYTTLFQYDTTFLTPSTHVISNVEKSNHIGVYFNEDMDPQSTIDNCSISPSVSGYFTVMSNSIKFVPDTCFASETIYALKVNKGATDLQGNTMLSNKTFYFYINGSQSLNLKVTNIAGTDGTSWQQNEMVPVTTTDLTNLSISFSNPIDSKIIEQFSFESYGTTPIAPDFGQTIITNSGHTLLFDLKGVSEGNYYIIRIDSAAKDIWQNHIDEEWVFYFQT